MWRIDFDPLERRLSMRLADEVSLGSMRELARAHAEALEATGGIEFSVMIDLRGMIPLDDDSVSLFADVKRVAASMPRFRTMAILVDSPTVAMQQQRTQIPRGPQGARDVITFDQVEAERFLQA